ncbi:hypothetical protein Bca4012_065927 [Brassica carinata]
MNVQLQRLIRSWRGKRPACSRACVRDRSVQGDSELRRTSLSQEGYDLSKRGPNILPAHQWKTQISDRFVFLYFEEIFMASVANTLCFVAALLLIYQKTATCGFLSPIFDNICKVVVCGKGKCKVSSDSTFKYECECDNGWKQLDHNLKFLPCVIPNCTSGLSCGEAGSQAQPPTPPKDNNTSFFDVCHWMNCGGGICKKKNLFSYSCECSEGYSNFMNIATSPCIKQCVLGQDCLNPGIPPNSSSNQGLNRRGSSLWLISSMICISLAPWRLLYI